MGCNQSKNTTEAPSAAPVVPAPATTAAPAEAPASPFPNVKGLEDAGSWMSDDEKRLTQVLLDAGQVHVFSKWTPGNEAKRHEFFEQARN